VADKVVTLRIDLTQKGIKRAEKELKRLNKTMGNVKEQSSGVSKRVNEVKRNLEGVSGRANRTNKDFGRMAQGMGGLVAVYATVAANVFALSSAFLILRRAADLSSMIKSSEDFSNRFGLSVVTITKRLQEATGGALSFAAALPVINKGISAGLGEKQMEELAVAATKAAQTFGGSATEALNRFISASQRGRVEIIQTLGVIIKTEQAYKEYGATIGKTALELSAFDRQQAIVRATIKESQNVFDQVDIDPNPFQQLLTTVTDLKDVMATFITDGLTPLINSFNKSKIAAGALIAGLIGLVGKRLIPTITAGLAAAQQLSVTSTSQALAAVAKAKTQETKVLLEANRKVVGLTKVQLLARAKLFKKFYATQLLDAKSFSQNLLNNQKKLSAERLLVERQALTKEINIRAGLTVGKRSAALVGIPTQTLKNQLNIRILLAEAQRKGAASVINLTKAQDAHNQTVRRSLALIKTQTTLFKASLTSFNSRVLTGFSRTFNTTQTNFIAGVKSMGRAWAFFAVRATTQTKGLQIAFLALGRAVGRTAGVIAGALSRVVSSLGIISIVVAVLATLWDKFGDSIRGITPELRKVIDAGKQLDESLAEINKRTAKGIEKLGVELPESLKKLEDALRFTAGTFGSINEALSEFRTVLIESLGGRTIVEARDRVQQLGLKIDSTRISIEQNKELLTVNMWAGFIFSTREAEEEVSIMEEELKSLIKVLEELDGILITRLANTLAKTARLASQVGFQGVGEVFKKELEKSLEIEGIKLPQQVIALAELFKIDEALATGDQGAIETVLKRLTSRFPEIAAEIQQAFSGAIKVTAETFGGISAQSASAGRSLRELNGNIDTFVLGLDKARASSGPDKELFSFALTAERLLKNLADLQEQGQNVQLEDVFVKPETLENVKRLIGEIDPANIREAADAAADIVNKFADANRSRLLGAQRLKALQVEISTLKATEIRSDEQRIENLVAIENLEIRVAKGQLKALESTRDKQQAILDFKTISPGITELELAVQKAIVDVLEAQITQQAQRVEQIKDSTKSEQESLKIQIEILDALKQENDIKKKIASINIKLSPNLEKDTQLLRESFDLQKQTLKIAEQKLIREIDIVEAKILIGELEARSLLPLQAQLELLERQTAELARQDLFILARESRDSGVSIFDKEGLAIAAQFFIRKVRDEALKLKTTFQILGEGFSTVIDKTFGAAVDNLLEGGKDFGRAVIETLKAGLREIIGEAIKTRIKEAISAVFNLESQAEKDRKEAAKKALEATEAGTTALEANTIALIANAEKECCCEQPTSGGNEETLAQQLMNGTLRRLERDQISGNQVIKNIENLQSESNFIAVDVGERIIAALAPDKDSFLKGIVGDAILSSITGAISFGTGGVARGGLSNIPKLATGAITNGPSLAFIGEGRTNEAVVPLPNNREIPVQLTGSQGDIINIEQNFDFSNATTAAIPQLRAEAKAIEDRTFNRVFSEINRGGKFAKMVGRR